MGTISTLSTFPGSATPPTGFSAMTVGGDFIEANGVASPPTNDATHAMTWSTMFTADHRAQVELSGSIKNAFGLLLRAASQTDLDADHYEVLFTIGNSVAPAWSLPDTITLRKRINGVVTTIVPSHTANAIPNYHPSIVGPLISLRHHRLQATDVVEGMIVDSQLIVRVNHLVELHEEITGRDAASYVGLVQYAGPSTNQAYQVFRGGDLIGRYVDPTGNDSNSGLLGAPWQTMRKGVTAQVAGEICFLSDGTYAEHMGLYTTGGTGTVPRTPTSFEDPVLFMAKAGHANVVNQHSVTLLMVTSTVKYLYSYGIIYRNSGLSNSGVGTTNNALSYPHCIQGGAIQGANKHGIHWGHNAASDNQGGHIVRDVRLEGNGREDFQVHNMYSQCKAVLVAYCHVSGDAYVTGQPTKGLGLQLYYSLGTSPIHTSGTVARHNVVHGHTNVGGSAGILMGRGSGNQVIGNTCYGNSRGIDVDYYCVDTVVYRNNVFENTVGIVVGTQTTTTNTKIYNNTLTRNGTGLWNNLKAVGTLAKNNLLWQNTTADITDTATTLAQTTNWLTGNGDPLLVDAGNDDHHLASGSPVATAGTDLSAEVEAVDFDGYAVPQNVTWAIGCFEFPVPLEPPTMQAPLTLQLFTNILTPLTGFSVGHPNGLARTVYFDTDQPLTLSATPSGSGTVEGPP